MYHNTYKQKPRLLFSSCIKCQSSSKVCPVVHAVISNKKALKSNTIKAVILTNEGRYHLLLLHKQIYDKKDIAKSLHTCYKARNTHSCL